MLERDAGFEGKHQLGRFASIFTVLVLAAAGIASAQDDQQAKPKVSDKPLTAEQLAVYRVVLANWMAQEMPALNLGIQTVPLGETGPAGDEDA